mgnify:CR=1 FL=1
MIKNRINNLRKNFDKFKIDGYVIPKNDEFFSEYANNDRLKKISNFSGSAGIAIILKKIISFNFTFCNKSYYYYTPNVMGLILCCRLKLNNRAIQIIVQIRTRFARHHPDWKKNCPLFIKH